MDVGNMVDAWLEGKATHPETLRSYRFVIASFREALVSEKIDLTSEPAAVAAVLDTWMRRSIHRDGVASSSTQVKRLSIIDNFFAYANLPSPVKLVERPILPVSEPKSVDIAEIQEVLAQLRNEAQVRGAKLVSGLRAMRDLALLRVALTTGRRATELSALRRNDLIIAGGSVVVSWRDEHVPLDPSVASDLLRWLEVVYGNDLDAIFPSSGVWLQLSDRSKRSEPLDAQGIRYVLNHRLGVTPNEIRATLAQVSSFLTSTNAWISKTTSIADLFNG